VLNGADLEVDLTAPEWPGVAHWAGVLDTVNCAGHAAPIAVGAHWTVPARSVLAFAGRP